MTAAGGGVYGGALRGQPRTLRQLNSSDSKLPSAARSVLPHAAIVQFGIRRHERLNMDKQDGEDRGLKLEYKRFTKSKDFKQG
jgi:hypothetical protein